MYFQPIFYFQPPHKKIYKFEAYVGGKSSTPEQVERINKMDVRAKLKDLSSEITPDKTSLNAKSSYTVKSTDTKGLLSIVNKMTGNQLFKDNANDQLKEGVYGHVGKQLLDQGFDPNIIWEGDIISVKDGRVEITRKTGRKNKVYSATLYSWSEEEKTPKVQAHGASITFRKK